MFEKSSNKRFYGYIRGENTHTHNLDEIMRCFLKWQFSSSKSYKELHYIRGKFSNFVELKFLSPINYNKIDDLSNVVWLIIILCFPLIFNLFSYMSKRFHNVTVNNRIVVVLYIDKLYSRYFCCDCMWSINLLSAWGGKILFAQIFDWGKKQKEEVSQWTTFSMCKHKLVLWQFLELMWRKKKVFFMFTKAK